MSMIQCKSSAVNKFSSKAAIYDHSALSWMCTRSNTHQLHTVKRLLLRDQQGVALTRRNRTGPPCSVNRPTAHLPGGRPARPPAALQTDTSEQNNTGPLGGPVTLH